MKAIIYTHGDPADPAACGRPLHERRDPVGAERYAIWVCPQHGVINQDATNNSVWMVVMDRIDSTLADRRTHERRRAERRGR